MSVQLMLVSSLFMLLLLLLFNKEPGPEAVLKEENWQEVIENESVDTINKIEIQESPVIPGANMQEDIGYVMLREEIQKEIKKHNIDSVVRSDVQKYLQGEEQMVLTPELLEAMIASSMEKVMDKYHEQLEEKMDKLNEILQQKTEILPTKIDERLQRIEHFLLKDPGSTYDDWIQRMKTSITGHICKICKFYKTSLDRMKMKKHNIDSVLKSDVQKCQQGEAQGVLTPEQFEAMIASSMEMVMDRYNDQLQEKLEKNEEKIKQGKRDKYNDHLQKYALPPSILYGTLCEFLFLSVHASFISNNLSFNPILIIILIY
ncbi:uncharacterized protein LOC111127383 [Crassostrea virginica]